MTPLSMGRKGGEPLLNILLQLPQFLHENKDILLAMFESIALVLQGLFIARDRRAEIERAKRTPLKFILRVNGKPLTIEAADAKDAVGLLEQFQKTYSDEAKKITTQSKMELEVHVPKKKRRGSH